MDKCSDHLHVGGLSVITKKSVYHLQYGTRNDTLAFHTTQICQKWTCFYKWKALECTNSGRQDWILLLSTLFEAHGMLMRRAAMLQPPARLPWRYSPTPAYRNYVEHFFRKFSCPKVSSAMFNFTTKALQAQHQHFRSKRYFKLSHY